MRQNLHKRIIAMMGIAVAVVFCAGIMMTQAEPAFAKDAGTAVSAKTGQGDEVFSFRKGEALDALKAQGTNYPDAFDLRNVNGRSYVTPVKLQNPYGTCWGFAAIAAAESSLIASGLADESVDLSEKHLAYFTNTCLDDPDSPQNGEGTIWPNVTREEEKTSAYKYNTGGTTFFATSMFASGIGPNLEDRTDPSTGASLHSILAYQGARGEKTTRRAATHHDAEGNPTQYARVPVWNSEDDDWSIPEKYRFYQSFRLKESINLPPIMDWNSIDRTYSFSEAGLLAVKQQMYEHHRAVSINFCAETFVPGQDTSGKKYMSDKWAHYTNQTEMSNHAVTIVGWDDHYPKENFLTEPPGDGAFLIKNSWGSELNEFPNNGYRHWGLLEGQDGVPYDANAKAVSDKATGYFWISYYDRSLGGATAFAFDKATGENGYYVEQMDYMQATFANMTTGVPGVRMANVFTAEATGKLTGISVMTTTPGTTVDYEVRLVPDDFTGPEDGILIAKDTKAFDYGGYHRITLKPEEQKVLARGQKYSVVVREDAEGEDYVCYTVGSTNPERLIQSRAIINPKESFVYANDKWNDVSDRKVQKAIMGYSLATDVMDNFPIKSYLEKVTYQDGGREQVFDGYLIIDNWEEGSPGTYEMFAGDSKLLTAEFRGIRQNMPASWDPRISWTSGDTSVMTVAPKTSDFAQATVHGEKAGSAYLTVDAGDYGMRLLRIKLNKLEVLYFGLKQDEFKYTGKPIKPELAYIVGDSNETRTGHDMVEGVDYVLSYKNNVNVGEGMVIARGIGEYTGTTDCTFTITGKTVALKVKGKTVKVKVTALKKKSVTIKASEAYRVTKAGGKLTYEKVTVSDKDAAKMFTVAKRSGNIKVKKGLKKGTYRLTVKVTAAGSGKRSAVSRNVKVTIRVK